jgi:flagellar protein FliO/FliZ
MFLHLACLPLAAVLINDVRSESAGGAITVDVATSEPVARADVRGVSGGPRRMFVYVQGTQASHRSFGSGPEAIVAHARARYTKLEIPTDGRCSEPMSVEATSAGIRVRASCQNIGMPAGLVAPPVRLPGNDRAEQPSPDAPAAALVRRPSQNDSLRAALALPAEATDKESDGTQPDDNVRGPAGTDSADKKAHPGATATAVVEKAAELPAANEGKPIVAKAAPPVPATQPDAPLAAVASVESSTSSPASNSGGESKSSSGVISTVLALLVLAGLGVAATLLARRRATRTRVIRIVETASIGPRRSLVVACIGGRTMVLGVSEAGVALLDAQAGTVSVPAAPESAQSASLEEAAFGLRGLGQSQGGALNDSLADAKHEGSLLSRLFHRTEAPSEAARRAHEFDELLAESLEDQDLRRKLSLGEAGRVA